MKKHEGKIKKHFQVLAQGARVAGDPRLPAGGGESYADANTIPGMAPSTEREGGSPVKT